MSEYAVGLIGVLIVGIEIGVLLCLILQAISRRRREQDKAHRQLQLETESLRRDLQSLRGNIDRLLQGRSSAP